MQQVLVNFTFFLTLLGRSIGLFPHPVTPTPTIAPPAITTTVTPMFFRQKLRPTPTPTPTSYPSPTPFVPSPTELPPPTQSPTPSATPTAFMCVETNSKQCIVDLPTPTPSGENCCSKDLEEEGYQCIQNCGPPVAKLDDPPPGYSCLSPQDIALRSRFGCPICLASNTMIDTPFGPINVTKLTIGMLVWSQKRNGEIIAVPIKRLAQTKVLKSHQVVQLQFADGKKVWLSPNHPTIDGNSAGNLSAGDTYDGKKIQSTSLVPYWDSKTYDLLPDSETGFYFANGVRLASTLLPY